MSCCLTAPCRGTHLPLCKVAHLCVQSYPFTTQRVVAELYQVLFSHADPPSRVGSFDCNRGSGCPAQSDRSIIRPCSLQLGSPCRALPACTLCRNLPPVFARCRVLELIFMHSRLAVTCLRFPSSSLWPLHLPTPALTLSFSLSTC